MDPVRDFVPFNGAVLEELVWPPNEVAHGRKPEVLNTPIFAAAVDPGSDAVGIRDDAAVNIIVLEIDPIHAAAGMQPGSLRAGNGLRKLEDEE